MAEDNFTNAPEHEFIVNLKDAVRDSIVRHGAYKSHDDIAIAAERLYPTIFNIVFNSNYSQFRHNRQALTELIDYLVTHIA